MILGGSWPFTNPEEWQSLAEAQDAKGAALIAAAGNLQGEADRVAAEQSGAAIDGYYKRLYREAGRLRAEADEWFAMSRVSAEISRLFYGLREDLDEIDRRAHEEIDRIRQAAAHTLGGGQVMWQAIQAVVAAARAEAKAADAKTASAITKHGTQIAIGAPHEAPAVTNSGGPVDPNLRAIAAGFGGGNPRNGMPTGLQNLPEDRFPGGGEPPSKDLPPSPDKTWRDNYGGDDAAKAPQGRKEPAAADKGSGTAPGQNGAPSPGDMWRESYSDKTGLGNPSVVTAALSGGSGSTSLGSSGAGGLKVPSTGGGLGGLSSPPLTQGLASGGLSPSAASASFAPPSSPITPPAAGSSDFTRGLNAGLGGAPAPFAPPVAPASPISSSAAPTS